VSKDHAAAHGGQNETVATSVESWEAREGNGVACLNKR
jgi:hypothetical protein